MTYSGSKRRNGCEKDMHRLILFDLDGTLTESHPGIIRSVQYALERMGYPVLPEDELYCFVGPPLTDSFTSVIHMSEEEAGRAVACYREYFSTKGKYENRVYAGIPELLERLRADGFLLGIASSKPEVFVRDILGHFGLLNSFDMICGATMDGSRSEKPDIIRYALRRAGYKTEDAADAEHGMAAVRREAVMVGDRKYDVTGAHAMGMAAVGVTWGYGSREELTASGADALAADPEELYRVLSRMPE